MRYDTEPCLSLVYIWSTKLQRITKFEHFLNKKTTLFRTLNKNNVHQKEDYETKSNVA